MRVDLDSEFEAFIEGVPARLRQALIGSVGIDDVDDAVAGALEWAWSHRDQLAGMDNPVGYLFRVGQSSVRRHRRIRLLPPEYTELPEIEPALLGALRDLPRNERIAVWLVHGCGWTHAEVAASLGVKRTTAGTHVARGLARLRKKLGVER